MCSRANQSFDEGYHQILFLRVAHGNHQGHRRYGVVRDERCAIRRKQQVVLGQKLDEQCRSTTLITINQRVVFNHEVQ